jgi:hypothetical protein
MLWEVEQRGVLELVVLDEFVLLELKKLMIAVATLGPVCANHSMRKLLRWKLRRRLR